ncbi:hypothetical protein CQW23_29771 [Capsicum baccatum]|uniref:Hydroxymethylglutaryl-coenzyme A synthase C-terminal domain-containing protein n=1 Tax=Capsicum baccatum TaxID=33114 RepID=A0A2G2VCC1_CAPBA|nr:hypothetical protein CQW23_29771 [Capsicum baccatum]
MALDTCYKSLCNKYEKLEGKQFSMADAAYFVFHSPYNKLVQRSFGRLVFNDFLRNASSIDESAKKILAPFESLTGDESYQSRDLEKASQQVAKPLYDEKVQPTTSIPTQVGNMYTASLYAALASLIHNKHNTLHHCLHDSPVFGIILLPQAGQRVIMFSYSSGLTATIFSLKFNEGRHPFSLSNIASVMNVAEKLKLRHEICAKDFGTSKDCSLLAPGTYYLTEVDSKYRRSYAKKTPEHGQVSQQVAKPFYDEKVEPTTLIPKQVGNVYTASLYAVFASLLHNKHDTLYEELCAFLEIKLPLGYKIPKFEKFDRLGNTFFHLKTYCEKLAGVGKNERIQVKLFSQSLSGKVLEWNAKQDVTKWCTWDDLANAFVDHYKFYVNIIPDKISIAKLRQKPNENFREYHTLEIISDQGTSSYGRSRNDQLRHSCTKSKIF